MSAHVVLFCGPSITAAAVTRELDADCRPPAGFGDVYAASRERPNVIALIDGVFERVPAVWHKEVLWALSQGITVFGAASMGALRAVELAPFGMEGVGAIFEAFRDGRLTADDEVAVLHAPRQSGYMPLSEALVNIRATLDAAAADGIIGDATRRRLVALAKSRHYPERSFDSMLADGLADGMRRDELATFSDWLHLGRVDQKRDDAEALLRVISERVDAGVVRAPAANFAFEPTIFWHRLVELVEARRGRTNGRSS
jgi:hypothetical protein